MIPGLRLFRSIVSGLCGVAMDAQTNHPSWQGSTVYRLHCCFFFLFRLGEMPNLIHDSDDNLALVVFAEAVLRVFCCLALHLLSIASFSCSSS